MGTYASARVGETALRGRADRRRKVDREVSEVILRRAEGLPDRDRAMLAALFEDGRSAPEVARLTGQTVRTVRRRARRIVARVTSPFYLFVLRSRASWPLARRRAVTAVVLHGLSRRSAARRLGCSVHEVRRHCDAALAIFTPQEKGAGDGQGV